MSSSPNGLQNPKFDTLESGFGYTRTSYTALTTSYGAHGAWVANANGLSEDTIILIDEVRISVRAAQYRGRSAVPSVVWRSRRWLSAQRSPPARLPLASSTCAAPLVRTRRSLRSPYVLGGQHVYHRVDRLLDWQRRQWIGCDGVRGSGRDVEDQRG